MIRLTRARLILACTAFVVVVGISLYSLHLMEEFLIRDARFVVPPAGDTDQSGLRVSGVAHASSRAVEAVFAEDFGRSLYLVPMEERLATLRTVDWVEDASIARIWPNRLVVNVTERTPVAFIPDRSSHFSLIDTEGVVLPPAKDRFKLPVLAGVRASDDIVRRREAVHQMQRVLSDLGDLAVDLSEIDVRDPDNIAVTREYEGLSRRLLLGHENFGQRYRNFLNHFGEIDAKVPGAKTIDLRLEDRITVVEAVE